jgi:tetratricopeptide (TPR) repeat protein
VAQATIDQAIQLALQNHKAGQLAQAEKIYRQILEKIPEHADALHLLGTLTLQMGQTENAVDLIQHAVRVNPNAAEYCNNLGVALRSAGKLDEAVAAYERAVQLNPNHAQAHSNLSIVLRDKGDLEGAVASSRRALRVKPNYAEAYGNLANALKDQGNLTEAINAYRRALNIRPENAEMQSNLGAALADHGQLDKAIAFYHRSIEIKPDYADAYNNLANALKEKKQFDDAIAAYGKAIEIKPDYADAHLNRALCRLLLGDFENGWPEYEWRWRAKSQMTPRFFMMPQWTGGELHGQKILLYAEQGIGDTLQFMRYAPLVAARGGAVILECQPPLKRLLANLPGVETVIAASESSPNFEQHCPLLSLGFIFRTDLNSIPDLPILKVDSQLVETWRGKLRSDGLKVGLAWAGNPKHIKDRQRSISLSQLSPLGRVKNVVFYSIQKGDAAKQIVPRGMQLIDFAQDINDFADTAALIANLDLIITVDTAVAHLAGTMGKPVWLLLPFVPDWRWFLDRQDSPWYPTMRLFRQSKFGDWGKVIQSVASALATH